MVYPSADHKTVRITSRLPVVGYTPEQIINKLREAEILLSHGETTAVISKKIGLRAHR